MKELIAKLKAAGIELTSSPELIGKLIEQADKRNKNFGYKKGSKKANDMKAEFIIGAISLMDTLNNTDKSVIPPYVYFTIMRGDELLPYKPEEK